MKRKGAAPREIAALGTGDDINGNAATLSRVLPPHICARLRAENIHTLQQWSALGPRRYAIFGITPSVVRQIDELARVRS